MQERAILSYHDTVLFKGDPTTLHEGQWLNDNILSFYFEYLMHDILKGDDSVLFLKPTISYYLTHQAVSPNLLAVVPSNMDCKEVIFIPVNGQQPADLSRPFTRRGIAHWSLLIYIRSTRTYHYFDSLAATNYSAASQTQRRIDYLLGNELTKIVMHSCPQQENGFDCGVFVVLFADVLARRYADLRLPSSPQMLDISVPDLIQRPMSPFANYKAPFTFFRPMMLKPPVIENTFWWIDYGDLVHPIKARKILLDLIRNMAAKKSMPVFM
ncbi:hypothetical protein EC988_002959 [Linderina pennispora]|nr:hypothetical protein EC988_002959 [Linderina pennispora]